MWSIEDDPWYVFYFPYAILCPCLISLWVLRSQGSCMQKLHKCSVNWTKQHSPGISDKLPIILLNLQHRRDGTHQNCGRDGCAHKCLALLSFQHTRPHFPNTRLWDKFQLMGSDWKCPVKWPCNCRCRAFYSLFCCLGNRRLQVSGGRTSTSLFHKFYRAEPTTTYKDTYYEL